MFKILFSNNIHFKKIKDKKPAYFLLDKFIFDIQD